MDHIVPSKSVQDVGIGRSLQRIVPIRSDGPAGGKKRFNRPGIPAGTIGKLHKSKPISLRPEPVFDAYLLSSGHEEIEVVGIAADLDVIGAHPIPQAKDVRALVVAYTIVAVSGLPYVHVVSRPSIKTVVAGSPNEGIFSGLSG